MKILYDHQIFSQSIRYSGISRYFYEIIKEFSNTEGIETEISLLLSDNYYISDNKYVKYYNFLPGIEFRGKSRPMFAINKINSIIKLNKNKYDIFHPTHYDPYFLGHLRNKPFVLTVYDMIHEKLKDIIPQDKTTYNKYLLTEKASKIITISKSTKNDLIEFFKIDESKIEVVYLGNSLITDSNSNINIDIPKKYLLFIGSRGKYKNFNHFIKSISKLLIKDSDLFVLCVGGRNFKRDEIKLFKSLNILRQVHHYNLDDDKLTYFYKNALLFVFPSLYEGFGIPILEAFACGCPVVCSNSDPFLEIADNGAYYFDPYSENSIRQAIIKVLEDNTLRNNLIKNGFKRVEQFSWSETAYKTQKIYESI